MPNSKAKQAAWMRAYRASKKKGGAALLPKALVRKLHRLGVDPARYLTATPVSLDAYHALERQLDAKTQRVLWQSSGIKQLQVEAATLRALLATQPAMQDTEVLKRIAQLETDQVLHEAEHSVPEQQESALDAVHRLSYTLHPDWNRGG